MAHVNIKNDLCSKCGACVESCPEGTFVGGHDSKLPVVREDNECIECGQCVSLCPEHAIDHLSISPETIKKTEDDLMPSAEQVIELMKTRRSVRALSKRPVERVLIEKVLDGARFAPSAHNLQSTEFIVIQNREKLDEIINLTRRFIMRVVEVMNNPLSRVYFRTMIPDDFQIALQSKPHLENVLKDIEDRRDPILHDAPSLILFYSSRHVVFGTVNANLALQNAALLCHALQLGSFYTGYVVAACQKEKSIPRLLGIPDSHEVHGGLAVGYPLFNYHSWIDKQSTEVKWIED